MSNYNDYVNDYMNSYNCPDCNDAKLQSDRNARKINEVIEQVNALIDFNNDNIGNTEQIVREVAEEKVNEALENLDIEEKVNEIVVEELNSINTEIDNINTSLDNLESEVNELKEGDINIDLSDYATKDYVDNVVNNMGNGSVSDEYIEGKINEILGDVLEENLDEEISTLISSNLSDSLKGTIRVSNAYSNGQTLTGGYLSIIDDDNAIQVWDILKPMSEELNVPFCLAVPSNDIKGATGGSLTKEQLKYLQDTLNWEICGHTVSHIGLGTLTYNEQLKEIRDNKALLSSYGLDVRGLAYPFGGYNNDTLEIMSQYYDYGFNGGQEYKYNTIDTFENYMIYRIAFGSYEPDNSNNGDLQYYKDKIDEVINNNGWLVLMTHITDTNHTAEDTEKLEQLIQYAKDRNVTISTPNKIFDKFKNLIEIPNKLKITNTGIINEFANKEKVNILNDDTKVATDLLTSFEARTITYTRAFKSTAGNENLPDNGTLETVNIGPLTGSANEIKDFNFRHQKLYGLTGEIWYRQPLTYNNWNWGEWKNLSGNNQSSGENTSGESTNIITETVVVPAQTIEPHTCVRFGVDLVNKNEINSNTAIVLKPQGGIEDNVVYNVDMWGTNSFGIKLLNIGNGSRNTAQRTWTVKIIN